MTAVTTTANLTFPVLAALVLGSLCAAGGTCLLKIGASGNVALVDYCNLRVASGLAFYAIGSGLWIYGMAHAPLSLVYPFNALTFVLVMAIAFVFLGERPTPAIVGGSMLILSGIGCIALGALR